MNNICYHCGKSCLKQESFDDKIFCCNGCKNVYQIINTYNLKKFYELNNNPGIIPNNKNYYFDFLDKNDIIEKFLSFDDENISIIKFVIPSIHCSSCIWLLENLPQINSSIIHSIVNFSQREIFLYIKKPYTLSKIANLLTQLGYKPLFNNNNEYKNKDLLIYRKLLYKIAIAFFCFGNIMLLTFPEYLSHNDDSWFLTHKYYFHYIIIILSLPSIFFSAIDYLKSAFLSIKKRNININVPITLGILILFFRSIYEIIYNIGSGYLDSLTGFIFFLLLGKFFQQKTYQVIYFDRDYKYYYPISVTRINNNGIEENILISNIKIGDKIIIRNEEIIPSDTILIDGSAMIDNSFITGESRLISKQIGDKIYAGGKQKGESIILKVIKEVNQSYLNCLWTKKSYKKKILMYNIINIWSRYFTIIIIVISLITGVYWFFLDKSKIYSTICSVLIVACPCALAISYPFTLGNIMRIFAKQGIFVKDIYTIERISKITTLVFDKTGTITETDKTKIFFVGKKLTEDEIIYIISLLKNSKHPLSQMLYKHLYIPGKKYYSIKHFEEIPGKGLKALINGIIIKIGSINYINPSKSKKTEKKTKVFVSIGSKILGYFLFSNKYRKGIQEIFNQLIKNNYEIHILSGDNNSEQSYINSLLPKSKIYFFQSPESKLNYIINLQKKGKQVMMLGDGINDIGALKQSEVGIAIFENSNNFYPSCDVLIDGKNITKINYILKLSKFGIRIILLSFLISIIYNLIGLSFAIYGYLTPIIVAILMPISSISVIIFTTLSTYIISYFINKKK
ncbi:MAG: heavy metal translocating P-type ATPase metal-binding domain-containing protein [Candidatus Bostrichicola ureolyticus]|nr:MAG: heavy metal translocating P-type ATPase metal-binding domain-containing protein [Candidatus Bostrichicola ureolyticus]